MKFRTIFPVALATLILPLAAQEKAPAAPSAIQEPAKRLSYSIGVDIGSSIKTNVEGADLDALIAGLRDSFTGGKQQMTPEEQQATLAAFQKVMMERQAGEQKKAMEKMAGEQKVRGEKAKKEGEDFLAANKGKEGVQTLPSGLQYKVITDGTGPQPKATDEVKVNYRGTLVDGTEFDSSLKSGPIEMKLNEVIKGWTEAIPLMKTGSKWQLFIPSNLGYGERGAGEEIPPNSTLIFEVELLGIKS